VKHKDAALQANNKFMLPILKHKQAQMKMCGDFSLLMKFFPFAIH